MICTLAVLAMVPFTIEFWYFLGELVLLLVLIIGVAFVCLVVMWVCAMIIIFFTMRTPVNTVTRCERISYKCSRIGEGGVDTVDNFCRDTIAGKGIDKLAKWYKYLRDGCFVVQVVSVWIANLCMYWLIRNIMLIHVVYSRNYHESNSNFIYNQLFEVNQCESTMNYDYQFESI